MVRDALDAIRLTRHEIEGSLEKLSQADPGDVQKIVASQIGILNGYYNLVMSQSRRSFYWALVAAGIGLFFFIGAISFIIAY